MYFLIVWIVVLCFISKTGQGANIASWQGTFSAEILAHCAEEVKIHASDKNKSYLALGILWCNNHHLDFVQTIDATIKAHFTRFTWKLTEIILNNWGHYDWKDCTTQWQVNRNFKLCSRTDSVEAFSLWSHCFQSLPRLGSVSSTSQLVWIGLQPLISLPHLKIISSTDVFDFIFLQSFGVFSTMPVDIYCRETCG